MIEALDGVIARLVADRDLDRLLAQISPLDGPRITVGWPWEMFERADPKELIAVLPRITVFQVTDTVLRPGIGRVQLQVDIWVWPVGGDGGIRRLYQIDERVLAVLDEATWHNGARLHAVSEQAVDFPAGPGELLRRSRTFEVLYSRTP